MPIYYVLKELKNDRSSDANERFNKNKNVGKNRERRIRMKILTFTSKVAFIYEPRGGMGIGAESDFTEKNQATIYFTLYISLPYT